MKISGYQKTTLLDYPGHVAATVFTGGCNFRCPFCHNGDLVLYPDSFPVISEEEFFSFLEKRKHILTGVCITGGEPTLQADLAEFIRHIHSLSLLVKLDSNGFRPDVLHSLLQEKLLDYVAMDIKSSKESYSLAAGIPGLEIQKIEESVSLLEHFDIAHEFRTTLVRGIHSEKDLISIGKWLAPDSLYILQSYKENDAVIDPSCSSFSTEELNHFLSVVQTFLPKTSLRGIDV